MGWETLDEGLDARKITEGFKIYRDGRGNECEVSRPGGHQDVKRLVSWVSDGLVDDQLGFVTSYLGKPHYLL